METRARQAVARIQEVQAAGRAADPERVDDSTTISRTLLLAQKTADETVAQARFDADQFRISARAEADSLIGQAHLDAEEIVTEARADARKVADAETLRAEAELQQLLVRLEFLRDDVAHMEEFTVTQRERLLEAAQALREVAERPVGGLGEIRSPVLHGATPHDEEPRGVYASLQDSWPEQDDFDDVPPVAPAPLGPGAAMLRGGEFPGEPTSASAVNSVDDFDVDETAAMPVPTFAAPSVVVPLERMFDEIPDADGLVVEEITAEVPIFQRPAAQNAMRFVGEEDV